MKIKLQGTWNNKFIHLNDMHLYADRAQEFLNQSPNSFFSWGYDSHESSILALAICLELFDSSKNYQEFKNRFIVPLPQDDFSIEIDITEWLMQTHSHIPFVRLSNGLYVGNHSSPHPFTFEDGSVLESCSTERSKLGLITMDEELMRDRSTYELINVNPTLTPIGLTDLIKLRKLYADHLVIVPFPVLTAYKSYLIRTRDHWEKSYYSSPFVTGRLADRVNKVLHIDKFCK